MRSLLDAVMSLGRGLELPQVLRGIVEAAVTLTNAEYGALGVVGDGQRLSQFLPVGMADELVARIGPSPCGRGILGELIHNPVPLRLTDLGRHPRSYGFPEHHPPMRSFLGVPVRVRDEVFGNLYLTEKRGGVFDADDEAVLTTLSIAAGVAIDHARMYEESRRRERWLEALGEITRTLLSGTDAAQVLHLIAEYAAEVAGADRAVVLLPSDRDAGARGAFGASDPSSPGTAPDAPSGTTAGEVPGPDTLTVAVAYGQGAERVEGLTLPVDGSLAGLAVRTGAPVSSPHLRSDERACPLGDEDAEESCGPVVAVPLRIDTGGCGALRLNRRAGRPPFDDTEVKLISGFADQAAIALELAQRRAESEELAVLHDRDRIARDLHDLAIQRLFATGMTLQSATRLIDRPEAAERVGRAVDDLDTTIQIIRSTIFGLRTAGVGPGGPSLRHGMAEAVRSAARTLGFTPSLRIEGPVDTNVPPELAEHVLAVAAEALSNAARHARARRVDITLAVGRDDDGRGPGHGDTVTLTVVDDGVGLGTARHTGGLANMRARAELHHGSLTVEAPSSGGTRITWRAPLPG
ncbi:GAF domain-containing sensor histidine kinase [Streptomyces sp. SAJ15]|uniref:sensor histidine kinase n=1 Tax=Streptomyces sp. SAJ15 TaxID=2011095 RepID=UPI0011846E2F|nr:GAF domain-containing sensor histidine kinase [Streptomyces sp. SAJ15]TVL91569.1 histidine kinase [Streptomyces sp. SAJ15]